MSVFLNKDCMEGMKEYPDKYFDLAIVDPPYGISAPKMDMGSNTKRKKESSGLPSISTARRCRQGKLRGSGTLKNRSLNKMDTSWDTEPPTKEYFEELFRVSKNQIIWGYNYFELPPSRGVICWDKKQAWVNFSQFELAWTSFNVPAAMCRICNTGGRNDEIKFHPTQKPIRLYEWLLNKYAKPTDIILDTHVGSGSSLIACNNFGYEFVGFEINPQYYDLAKKRIEKHAEQLNIFNL